MRRAMGGSVSATSAQPRAAWGIFPASSMCRCWRWCSSIGTAPTARTNDRSSGDLRESGDLENTADSVLGVYRDEMEHPETKDRGLAERSVLKKRQLGEDVGTMRRLVW